ncbi:MAG: argininosuccinate lyase [Syntrophomonadaceae bacterium]|jgi:argininosuccinate lyase|nr:argininosuccinate lyase [Syntrophomonadaceae bacterium]
MKLWGGRFTKDSNPLTEEFNSSITIDGRMYKQDILGSIAHAAMLGKQGIITLKEKECIVGALEEILRDLEAGRLILTEAAEDIHMNIETFLIDKIGETGKKLHTGRSRNDQVALDIRMYMREEIKTIYCLLIELMETILALAYEHAGTVMPGYTHLQKAQPISLGHYLMAYFEMLRRDLERLNDCYKRIDYMPLGAGALAGTGFDLDREYVKEMLNFGSITRNSLDSVSDRDFALEFCSWASILMMHLSRWAEEIVLWSTEEFAFIELDDAYTTGSSIMPQKKNPDLAELIRGKTGRVYGDLINLLVIMKGLPLAYNKDMQEDKEALFDAVDTVSKCLTVFIPMLKTASFRTENMNNAARQGFTNATDFADYLVNKGVAFRNAHEIVGQAVLYCLQRNISLNDIEPQIYKEFSPLIEDDIYQHIETKECLDRRKVMGGTASFNVIKAVKDSELWLKKLKKKTDEIR